MRPTQKTEEEEKAADMYMSFFFYVISSNGYIDDAKQWDFSHLLTEERQMTMPEGISDFIRPASNDL